jgi:hypothetical protein
MDHDDGGDVRVKGTLERVRVEGHRHWIYVDESRAPTSVDRGCGGGEECIGRDHHGPTGHVQRPQDDLERGGPRVDGDRMRRARQFGKFRL